RELVDPDHGRFADEFNDIISNDHTLALRFSYFTLDFSSPSSFERYMLFYSDKIRKVRFRQFMQVTGKP
ncbi:MAG TPA: hypothetical protein VGK13_07390, partial [Methanocellaceae archaeon]